MRQYQYLMNILLFIVRSDALMGNQDIKLMFNSDIAIDSWFWIINKDYEFNFISKYMKCMVYQILTETLKADKKFTRQRIMLWTYNIDKTEKLVNRITFSIKYFTDSIIKNKNNFNLNDHENDKLSDYYEIRHCIKFLIILCDRWKEFQDYLRAQHNRIKSSNIVSSIVTLIRVCLSFVKYKFALKLWTETFKVVYALNNQMNNDYKEFFMSIRTHEFVKQIMELGWFSKDKYYFLNRKEKSISKAPVFNSNKMILKLKLIALEVSHQMINNENRHEFSNSIGKEILDANLKIGYAQLLHLNNGVMHSKFFDKRDKTRDSFNIQMLFSWYSLRAKISDKDEIKEQNIIQLFDTQNIFIEASKVVKMSLFNLFKSKNSNFGVKDCNNYLKKEEFETDVLNFYESCSSHIEIVVPNNKLADPSKHDPFLNFQDSNSVQVKEENQAVVVTKYLTIPPRFLSITQKQKTDFWTGLKSDDPKVFWKLLQKYGIETNKELSIMEKVQNSKFTLPDWVKRASWLEMLLALLVFIINVIIFLGYKVNSTDDSVELLIFNSKVATYVIVYGIGGLICSGYFYIIVIRLIIIFRINWGEFKISYSKKKNVSIPKYAWNSLVNLYKWTLLIVQSQDLWCLTPCFIFAMLGMTIHFYYFVFCIIVAIIYVDSLMEVILAIWVPKYRIAWTLLLTLGVLYIYAALSFTQFRKDYSQNIANSCDSVYNCLITISDQWYKNNALGGFLSTQVPAIVQNSTFKVNWGRFFFDLIFFIAVPTLLVNIISGIIIDNFGERRSKRDELREYQQSRCFVCGKLDNDILDFSHHTKFEHNCWDYVYYIGILKNTEFKDLKDSTDIYVKKMIENNNSEWFPCYHNNGSSISTAIQEISAKQDGIEKNSKESFIKLEDKIEEKIGKLKEELNSNLESKLDSKLELQFSKIKDLLSK